MPEEKPKMMSILITCPVCKIPYLKIYYDGRQSYLKWHNKRMNETYCRGITEIYCFKCGETIDVVHQILTTTLALIK